MCSNFLFPFLNVSFSFIFLVLFNSFCCRLFVFVETGKCIIFIMWDFFFLLVCCKYHFTPIECVVILIETFCCCCNLKRDSVCVVCECEILVSNAIGGVNVCECEICLPSIKFIFKSINSAREKWSRPNRQICGLAECFIFYFV